MSKKFNPEEIIEQAMKERPEDIMPDILLIDDTDGRSMLDGIRNMAVAILLNKEEKNIDTLLEGIPEIARVKINELISKIQNLPNTEEKEMMTFVVEIITGTMAFLVRKYAQRGAAVKISQSELDAGSIN